jgi:GNAT superfamily N-acetyltransferase
MQFELLGWPEDGPTLRLDWEVFSYAGKFVMSNTGKAVLRHDGGVDCDSIDPENVLAAVAFNEDRTDETTLWLRYVTVQSDLRGEGLGPELVSETVDRALARGYERIRIAVNNPFAYEALWKAGFGFTGEETGIAELVLVYPREQALADHGDADTMGELYRNGIQRFRGRETLSEEEKEFLSARRDAEPPDSDS